MNKGKHLLKKRLILSFNMLALNLMVFVGEDDVKWEAKEKINDLRGRPVFDEL